MGASGSDKTEIRISETGSTAGYKALAIVPGQWAILVGAYKIQPEGLTVRGVVCLQGGRLPFAIFVGTE